MKVKLPIFFNTEETNLLEDLGIENKNTEADEFDEYEKRDLIFYSITAIFKYLGEDKYTTILSNSDKFICCLPIEKVEKLIDDAN